MAENIRNIATRAALDAAFDVLCSKLARIADIDSDYCIFQGFNDSIPPEDLDDARLGYDYVCYFNQTSGKFWAKDLNSSYGNTLWLDAEKFGVPTSAGVVPYGGRLFYCLSDGKWYVSEYTKSALKPIDLTTIGWPNGVAPLDSERKVPMANLPARVYVSGFDGVTDNVGNLQQQSVSVAEKIHFYTKRNTFVAFADGKYYNNWAGSAEYGTQTQYGIAPEQSKLYLNRSTNNEQRWTGEALITVDAFLDDYVASLGIKRDQNTGLYSLNGLTDITYSQMVKIVSAGRMFRGTVGMRYYRSDIRTHLPASLGSSIINCEGTFMNSSVEVVSDILIVPLTNCFNRCSKLRSATIWSPNGIGNRAVDKTIWAGCSALEEIKLNVNYETGVWLADSPKLSLLTFKNQLIPRHTGSVAHIITVHPDVYAKMTDESNAEWHALLSAAEAKNISFATI